MPTIHFVQADGSRRAIDAEPGEVLMQIARRHQVDGILAECGGVCSCATCHVHIDPAWRRRLPPIAEMEGEMLEFASEVDDASRLSCQIKITAELDGMVVNVPASQY